MTDTLAILDTMKRPRLLIRAARHGAGAYRREIHLSRHLDMQALPDPQTALGQLIDVEAGIERARIHCHAHYAVARHLDVLIAIMGEARLLRAARSPAVEAWAQDHPPPPGHRKVS